MHQFFDDGFISRQYRNEVKNYLLQRLLDKKTSHITQQHLPNLESILAKLAPVNGYDKLKPLLRRASDMDSYDDTFAQIDITFWFKEKGLVKEIEPKLPNKDGYSDILPSFSEQDIYCEVTSFQSIIKSLESEAKSKENETHNEQQKIDRAVRNLLVKTKRQLPPGYPGILALDSKAGILPKQQIRKIAERLFPKRPQLALIMRRGLKTVLPLGIPPVWCVNTNSHYQNIGRELLKYLGQDNNAFDC